MRYSLIAAITAVTVLSGCVVPARGPVPNAPTLPGAASLSPAQRVAARNLINAEMSKRLPGVNTQPYTDCVVSNASTADLADLAGIAYGSTGSAADSVAVIIKRPATTQCIAKVAATA